jgi:hypothetical protein
MNEGRAAKIAALVALGKWDFIIQRGMFGFGVGFALLTILWDIYDGKSLVWDRVRNDVAIKVLVLGPLWGFFMWKITEWRYKKPLQSQSSENSDLT